MEVTETNSEGLSRELKVVVPAGDIDSVLEARLRKLAAGAKIPGFRPGKVPLSLLKKRYAASVMGEVLETTVNEQARRVLDEQKMRFVGKPDVKISDYQEGGALSFTIALDLFPEMPEFDLKSLELTRYVVEVDPERVEEALADIAGNHERFRPLKTPRKARKGDLVIFDFVGHIAGKPFAGGVGKDERIILGSGRYIKGYEEQMIGCEIGRKTRVEVEFPLDYRDSKLAGKQAHFDLDIKDIQEADDVVVDERLAKEMGYDDLAALREKIRERLGRDLAHLSRLRLRRDLHDALRLQGDFDLPSRVVETEFSRMWVKPGDDNAGKNKEDLTGERKEKDRARTRDSAERRVRLGLMLAEIGRFHDLSVSEQEIGRSVETMALRYPGQEAQFIQHIKNNPEMIEQIRGEAYEEKILDFILEMATISETSAPLETVVEIDLDVPLPPSIKKEAKETESPVTTTRHSMMMDQQKESGVSDPPERPTGETPASNVEEDIAHENAQASLPAGSLSSRPASGAKKD